MSARNVAKVGVIASTKISAGADPGTVVATDKVPMARSASTTAYAATVAEIAAYANGAYVPTYASATPAMDGTGAPGTAATVSRGDHKHPTDTSVLSLGGGTMTGLLTLSAVPTVSLHAATKGYVDTATGSSTAAIPGASYCDNGGFTVNQRTYVSGTALAAAAFGHDRWKAGSGGCTYTFTQSGTPATTITITAGTLQQVVEGAAIIGGTYTLSWTGTAQGRVGAGAYAASPVTASGIVASANTTIEFNAGTLGRVKFEAGSTATPWVAASPHDDLVNCQRFFQAGYFMAGSGTYGVAANTPAVMATLPEQMRALPTMTIIGSPALTNCSAPALAAWDAAHFQSIVTVTATGIYVAYGQYTASADL